jgi:S-formylglutathione hydrolase FrmB
MAVCEIHFNSFASVGKMSSATVILPEGKPGPFPVFYLLHGLSDDHTAWVRRTSIERYVQNLPLIVVMPNGERSFYCDAAERANSSFETMIVRDLMGFVDNTFQTIPTREGRVIAGLSMGGYGAWKLALKHPDKFCAAVSHSGALAFASRSYEEKTLPEDHRWLTEFRYIFGANPRGGTEDVFALVEKIDRKVLPALRFDCGVDDFLFQENRELHAHLNKLGIPHEYEEFPGAHTWDYWDEHIQETVKYFARQLAIVTP